MDSDKSIFITVYGVTNQNYIHDKIMSRLNSGNASYIPYRIFCHPGLYLKTKNVKWEQSHNFACCFMWTGKLTVTQGEEQRLRIAMIIIMDIMGRHKLFQIRCFGNWICCRHQIAVGRGGFPIRLDHSDRPCLEPWDDGNV